MVVVVQQRWVGILAVKMGIVDIRHMQACKLVDNKHMVGIAVLLHFGLVGQYFWSQLLPSAPVPSQEPIQCMHLDVL